MHAFAWPWQKQTGPPRPDSRFTKEDIQRIKAQGPSLADVTAEVDLPDATVEALSNPFESHVTFVPPSVLGDHFANTHPEPQWNQMEKMPPNLFIFGLRKRNWVGPYYDACAPKWKLEIWQDSGSRNLLVGPYKGYKVVIQEEGQPDRWTHVNEAGHEHFLEDYLGGASLGSVWKCVSAYCSSCHRQCQQFRPALLLYTLSSMP